MDANKKSQTRSLPKKFLNQPPVLINPILLQSKSNSNLSINQNSQSELMQTQIGQTEFEKQIIPEELILLYISINIFIY